MRQENLHKAAITDRSTDSPPPCPSPVPLDIEFTNTQHVCENCGAASQSTAADIRRIAVLESQVQWLTVKASAAVDKLADYEDQLRELAASPPTELIKLESKESSQISSQRVSAELRPKPSKSPTLPSAQLPEKRFNISNRFQTFLNRRGVIAASGAINPPQPPIGFPSPDDVSTLLHNERQARIAAEGSLEALQLELEELSAALFSQANEMVADERRLRAKDLERIQNVEEQASLWQNRARQMEARCKRAEEEAQLWAVKARDLEGRRHTSGPKTEELRARDEERWKRVEALERAVDRLSVMKRLAFDSSHSHKDLPGEAVELTRERKTLNGTVNADGRLSRSP